LNQGYRVTHIESFSLARASLAVSRYVLSLDPLRDPMGVLLALDHFALLSNSEVTDRWLVDFVESHKVRSTSGSSSQLLRVRRVKIKEFLNSFLPHRFKFIIVMTARKKNTNVTCSTYPIGPIRMH
jgi:hypothetical protein